MSETQMHGPYPDEADQLNKTVKSPSGYTYEDNEDNGTMPEGVQNLRDAVVGHKIVKVEKNAKLLRPKNGYYRWDSTADLVLTLDNGKRVALIGVSDCCAYGSVEDFAQKLPSLDHIITDVGTTEVYTKWHILAGMEDVLELTVGWSPGNAFYYAYGIEVEVLELDDENKEN